MIRSDYRVALSRTGPHGAPEDLRRYLRAEFGEEDSAWFMQSSVPEGNGRARENSPRLEEQPAPARPPDIFPVPVGIGVRRLTQATPVAGDCCETEGGSA